MLSESLFHRCWKHRASIFVAFAGANDNLVTRENDIFDPQLQTLHQSQARALAAISSSTGIKYFLNTG